jgi:hypothetical protein
LNFQKQSNYSVSSFRAPIRNTADYSPFGIQLDGRTISYVPPAPAPPSVTVVYQHKFDDNPSTHPYTTAPNQLNTKLTNVSWTNSQSSWTNFAGFTGKAIATNSATPDTTRLYLNLTVNNGFMLDVKSYSFYHRSSTTGYTNYQLLVNGILVGSGSIFVSSGTTLQSTGTINVANAVAGLTGSVTVTLKLFGGSNGNNATFRLDDFTLNGYTQEVQVYAEGYRYGFQNQEKDDEIKGAGNSVNYTFRMHDPRVGRFFAVDPLSPEYPWNSPYAFSENRVIDGVELEGLEWKQFQELNPDEKVVALANPYDAYIVGENAKVAFKYAGWTGLSGARDGRQDAYRHAFWNSINSRDISSEDAKKFADAHETGSTSYNSKSDDYDPIATKMDLHNNWVGRQIGALNPNATNTEMSQFIKQALADGKLKMILVKDFEINGQSISIAFDKKGRPVVPKSETNLIKELNSSGYKVNTNTKDKQLVRSNHPQIKATGSANQKAAAQYGDDSNDYEYNEGSKEGQKK